MDNYPVEVLLVDDDEDDYIITRDLLSEIEGRRFDLEWVATYDAAWEAIQLGQHDVYLLDYRLGKRNGLELLRQALESGCKAPMILLTGQGDREVDLEAMRAGAADYLVKGQMGAPLLERSIRYALERTQTLRELRASEERLRRRAAELEALADVSSALRTAETVEEMLPLILEKTIQTLNAACGVLFLARSDTGDLVARASYPPDAYPRGWRRPPGKGITGHVVATGEVYITEDLSRDPLAHILPQEEELLSSLCNLASLPLRTQERVIGVMHVAFYKRSLLTSSEIRLATAIADIAANALHRADVLETLEQRVAERTRELEKANVRLQELDRLKSKFVTDVSHELRTPTANIKLYLHLLERSGPEKRAQRLAVLKDETDQLVDLIENILSLSRLDLKGSEMKFGPVDLNALVEQELAAHKPRAEAANLQLTFEPCPALPPVHADRNRISQVIANLLTNAINYTPAGGVTVRTNLEEEQACLEVQDTGVGIESEDLPHVFERFYRGQGIGSSNIPGSGLGLAIVKEIVDLHGGRVEVESEVGEGSVFRVWLPLEDSKRQVSDGLDSGPSQGGDV